MFSHISTAGHLEYVCEVWPSNLCKGCSPQSRWPWWGNQGGKANIASNHRRRRWRCHRHTHTSLLPDANIMAHKINCKWVALRVFRIQIMVSNELISLLHAYALLIVYIHKYIFWFHTYMDGRWQCARTSSATATRTRVARVRAEYPNQLDYGGIEWNPEI